MDSMPPATTISDSPSCTAWAAHFVDSHGGDARVAATFQGRLASWILTEAGLDDVAENCFVNLFWIEVRATDRFGNCFGAQLNCGKTR
jgi:hypothetical protein